jgi:hypothetical protein
MVNVGTGLSSDLRSSATNSPLISMGIPCRDHANQDTRLRNGKVICTPRALFVLPNACNTSSCWLCPAPYNNSGALKKNCSASDADTPCFSFFPVLLSSQSKQVTLSESSNDVLFVCSQHIHPDPPPIRQIERRITWRTLKPSVTAKTACTNSYIFNRIHNCPHHTPMKLTKIWQHKKLECLRSLTVMQL